MAAASLGGRHLTVSECAFASNKVEKSGKFSFVELLLYNTGVHNLCSTNIFENCSTSSNIFITHAYFWTLA